MTLLVLWKCFFKCDRGCSCASRDSFSFILKNRPITYKNIGTYTDSLLLKNIFIGLYIRLSVDAWFISLKYDQWNLIELWIKHYLCTYLFSNSCQISTFWFRVIFLTILFKAIKVLPVFWVWVKFSAIFEFSVSITTL